MNFTDDLKEDIKADEDLESGTRTPTKSEKVTTSVISAQPDVQYRMYKRRYAGLFAFIVLNIVGAMSWPWFGPISNNVSAEFDISLTQVNWLGNAANCVFLVACPAVPYLCAKMGIRNSCYLGGLFLLLSAWIRYAGTIHGLSKESSYALLMVGQLLAASAQPIWQVLGPMYSERWFDLKGRTTATMLIAVSNPIGGAIGQIIAPVPTNTRTSILLLGILSTAVVPFVFLIAEAPPIAPTHAGSIDQKSFTSLLKVWVGMEVSDEHAGSRMTRRERLDLLVLFTTFGVLVGQSTSFGLLTGEIFVPFGYSDTICGLLGSVLLLAGLAIAILTAPLFDRVFTYHLALVMKVLTPMVGIMWLCLIWAVKANNTAALFVLMALIGACSVPMLPVGLELACEVTRNSNGSSALLWFSANLYGIMFVLAGGALAAPITAPIPFDMHKDLVFSGVVVLALSVVVFGLRGKQVRREMDEKRHNGDAPEVSEQATM